MSKIEQALLDATGLKPMKKGANRATFLSLLAKAVEGLKENEWEKLVEECKAAGDWYNAYVDAAEKNEELPDIPADEEEESEEGDEAEGEQTEDDSEADEGEDKPKKDAKKKAAKKDEKKAAKKDAKKEPAKEEKKAAPKKEEKKTAEKSDKKPRGGAEVAIITAAIKKPKATAEEIGEIVKEQGHKVATSTIKLQVMRTRRVMSVLTDLGKLS